jgi:hypothetical protein
VSDVSDCCDFIEKEVELRMPTLKTRRFKLIRQPQVVSNTSEAAQSHVTDFDSLCNFQVLCFHSAKRTFVLAIFAKAQCY